MITSFKEWMARNDRMLSEDISEEAWELLGQGFKLGHPVISKLLQRLGLTYDEASVEKITAVLGKLPTTILSPDKISQLDNLANKIGDQAALTAIMNYRKNPQGDPTQAYAQAMQTRDSSEGRSRGYDVSLNAKRITSGNYEPPLLVQAGGKMIVVGGRTRLYAALALNKPVKVIVATEQSLRQGLGIGNQRPAQQMQRPAQPVKV